MEEILARMGELRDELETLAAVEGDFDEAQEARWAEANSEFDGLNAKKDALEARAAKIADVRKAAINPEARVSGDGNVAKNVNIIKDAGDPYDLHGVRNVKGNYGGSERAEVREEYVSRARRAIEASRFVEDGHQDAAMRLLDTAGREAGLIADHMLRTGSDAYKSAFNKYMANPMRWADNASTEERAALAIADANGGYLIPFTLDPSIILTNNGATNPFRGISTIKSTVTDSWSGVTSAGVTAEWLAEATGAADGSPTFGQPTITPAKAAAYIQASFEVMQDSGVAGELAGLIADARDRLEATAFAVGSGSGQPKGIVTALQLVTASRVAGTSGAAGAADFVVGDVFALANALPPRFRPGSSWLGEQTTYNSVRRFGTSTNYFGLWTDNMQVGLPGMLLGRPAYESSELDNTVVSGSNDDVLILGSFKDYYIVDRIGMTLQYEPLVKSTSTGRPTGEAGWFAHWRVGADCVNANAFRMLRL
jgi:HK97 family phage major capsid protein